MAPTQDRSTPDVPTKLNSAYSRERASFRVIVAKGTQPSEGAQGYITPGVHTETQVAGEIGADNDIVESDTGSLYRTLVTHLAPLDLRW